MPKSRRKSVTTKTGETISSAHCRRCMGDLPPAKFYSATDIDIDKNGLLSICKGCIHELFTLFYSTENSIEKTVLRLCRKLNIKYSEEAIEAAKIHKKTLEDKGVLDSPFMGIYFSKLYSTNKTTMRIEAGIDLQYSEVTHINVIGKEINDDAFDGGGKDLKAFWGTKFQEQDYAWLEGELAEWKNKHKIDTKSEESLLQLIILKRFDIRKAREEDRDTSSLEKEYQALLKTSALSPSMTNVANSGDALDTYGKWIADIEKEEPAQWLEGDGHEKYGMFRDVDDVDGYFQKYFVRPLRNLILQAKDFNIDDNQNEEDDGLIEGDAEAIENNDATLSI